MQEDVKLVKVKDVTIGGKVPAVCIPLVARTKEELVTECENISGLKPDIVEWRADYFDGAEDEQDLVNALINIRNLLPDYPVIFTCRMIEEGGVKAISKEIRAAMAKTAIRSGLVDIVDFELINGGEILAGIIDEGRKANIYVVVSHHNFAATPPKEVIINKLLDAQNFGGDIAKIAVMPEGMKDVLTLLEATLEFKEKHAKIPFISISMSGKGAISRTAGHLFGSCLTFASGTKASAPGQISIDDLRTSIDILKRSV
ncbi:3-dehydroquinate dehydratase [Oxobacter pfennigii]|uniref:3-dehydroquinate dehydratase n=1 Tax=Oxobacter pfennigii TaxID=36849 RepID=A0A0P8WY53_9CLOT|nr:type I 3-dehydroquinate dehydratase [Oxobacter pfennigii]KPU43305.1 3-dehydroquinate dehydratase [Oxobacter pfennigii]